MFYFLLSKDFRNQKLPVIMLVQVEVNGLITITMTSMKTEAVSKEGLGRERKKKKRKNKYGKIKK